MLWCVLSNCLSLCRRFLNHTLTVNSDTRSWAARSLLSLPTIVCLFRNSCSNISTCHGLKTVLAFLLLCCQPWWSNHGLKPVWAFLLVCCHSWWSSRGLKTFWAFLLGCSVAWWSKEEKKTRITNSNQKETSMNSCVYLSINISPISTPSLLSISKSS